MSSDGSRIAIGAIKNNGVDENGNSLNNSGHVKVYDWNGTSWTQVGQDIDGEGANDYSGHSVAMSSDGSRIAIGAIKNNGVDENGNSLDNSGHVRVHKVITVFDKLHANEDKISLLKTKINSLQNTLNDIKKAALFNAFKINN
jgi:hypothetical protein